MAVGSGGSIGGLWSSFKSGVTKAISMLSLIPAGTPMAGGVGSVAKLAVKTGVIPAPVFDDDSEDDFWTPDSDPVSKGTGVSVASIFSRKVAGIPIVPVALALLAYSLFKKGK